MTECPYVPADLTRLIEGDAALVRCPFPLYDVLREQAPVTRNDRLNAYVVTRYDDVIEVLKDTDTYSSAMASGPNSVTGLANKLLADPATPAKLRAQAERRLKLSESPVLLFTDPPLHKRQRALVSAAFSPKRVKALEPEVRRLTEELIDGFLADGKVDLVPQFSIPLPMTVIATLLGVPPSDMDQFKRWSNAFTAGVGSVDQSAEDVAGIFDEVDTFYDYFTREIELRRVEPQDDLLTDLVAARMEGEAPLTLDEILQMLVQFLVAGNETTTNSVTTLMFALAQDPELADRVRSNPALVAPLVEEMLRVEAPVQGMFRVSTADSIIAGVEIPAGSVLWLVYGSANRDPGTFPDPAALKLDGDRAPHVTFARFEHFCLGSSIARLELRIAAELLLERLNDIALDCPADEVPYHRSFVLRGPASLPLTFTAR
ncbi:cytochrome P450 [Sporichthya sp.]|uniref:cytochrome P450 n=1 Tax=Sporichthya sp. TaxID=65475 RepID=UPI001802D9BB|nr:cytochrome P450 [Sporichthya sp.]MBA3743315.1 cytochrome P450 [Sporichthya sp.]